MLFFDMEGNTFVVLNSFAALISFVALKVVLGGITFLLSVYGMTNLEQYFTVFDKAKLHKENCIGKHCLCTYPRHTYVCNYKIKLINNCFLVFSVV